MFPSGSNTYIGLIVTVAPLVLSLFGFAPTPAFNEQFPNEIAAIVSLIGAVYATYGRLKASTPGWFAKQ